MNVLAVSYHEAGFLTLGGLRKLGELVPRSTFAHIEHVEKIHRGLSVQCGNIRGICGELIS